MSGSPAPCPHPPSGIQDGDTPLICASREGHHEVVKTLAAWRADVDVKDKVGDESEDGG